jgi:chemotaxis signal transduction protein
VLPEEPQDWVVVDIGGQPFGFAAHQVSAIIQMVAPIPVPSWPDCALGMIDVHGDLLPLVDPAPGLGQPPVDITSRQYIVIVMAQSRRWGLVVNQVEGVRNVRLRPTGLAATSQKQPFAGLLAGEGIPVVALDPEALVRVLDLERLETQAEH